MPKPLTNVQIAELPTWSGDALLHRYLHTGDIRVVMALQAASGVAHKGPGDPDIDQMLVEFAALGDEVLSRTGNRHKTALTHLANLSSQMATHTSGEARSLGIARLIITPEDLITLKADLNTETDAFLGLLA